ncbi:MAG: glycosyltransferase [Pseudomonadota bacterium]
MKRQSRMRACMIVHAVYQSDPRVRRYAEYLAADGWTIDVVCLAAGEGDKKPADPNIRVYAVPLTRKRKEGFRHILQWAVSALLMFFFVTRLDLQNRYDVVHVNNMPDFLVFCALIPRLRGCPVILDVHDPIPEITMSKLGVAANHPLVRAQAVLEKISVLFSNAVITATDSFKRILAGRGANPEKITVVMNAPDPLIFSGPDVGLDPVHRDGFTLLYVGTVAPRYGLDVAIRMLPLVRDSIPGLRLRIVPRFVDEGTGLQEVLELSRELSVDDMIDLDHPHPLEDMPRVMREADVGLYPARRDCHMDVALSLKIPEMAAVGLCMAATRLSVLEDLFGEEAVAFFPSGDHEALAEIIVDLYRRPEERGRMIENAASRARALMWDGQYGNYLQVLEKLIGRDPRITPAERHDH